VVVVGSQVVVPAKVGVSVELSVVGLLVVGLLVGICTGVLPDPLGLGTSIATPTALVGGIDWVGYQV
jgi:hypothetical protein